MAFTQHLKNGVLYYTADGLCATGGIHHGFSSRIGGVSPAPFDTLNLDIRCGDNDENIQENYRRFCRAIGTDVHRVVLSQQTHHTNIRHVDADDAGKGLWRDRDYCGIDALITDVPGLALTVFSADCGIILLYDPIHQAVGAVHAGWRGCAAGILEKTIREMTATYGSDPQKLLCAIGPCIGQCCFETDEDVPLAMRSALDVFADPYIEKRGSKYHVDLEGLNRQWLLLAGVPASQIECAALCTACHPELFWSHRKMGRKRGTQIAMIALTEEGMP